MSIKDQDNNEIVTLGTVNAWAFKIAIWFAPFFAVWIVNSVISHDKSIGLHELRLTMLEHRGGNSSVSQNVNVGSNDEKKKEDAAITRGYYTVGDVAEKLQKSERTVTDLCKNGLIKGAFQPEGGRGWRIPLDFDISDQKNTVANINQD